MAHAIDSREAHFEISMRRQGWITIDEAGWDGNLICHKDHSDERDGPEFASWEACWKADHQQPRPSPDCNDLKMTDGGSP